MPRKTKTSLAAARELPAIPEELIAHFVKGPMTAGAVQDASMAFKKALIRDLRRSRGVQARLRRFAPVVPGFPGQVVTGASSSHSFSQYNHASKH
ncbi:Mobile element protein [Cupriavidus basilensis]|uniref:Mobile element protein n=1 Tax=Cupriavidus basilensis TaxID=68895 RepID=A0A0C4YUV6_9BURK|nr:Mobile element protein [Cupriavidus basilensis]